MLHPSEGAQAVLGWSPHFSRWLAPRQAAPSILAHTVASVLEFACIYSALILHNKEVMVTEGKINALVKAAGVNTGPSWPGLFANTLASVNIGDLTRKAGASGPAPAASAEPDGGPAPSTPAAPGENKKAEAQERIWRVWPWHGFWSFWLNLFRNTYNKRLSSLQKKKKTRS